MKNQILIFLNVLIFLSTYIIKNSIYILFIFSLFINSCSNKTHEKHKDLVYFDLRFLAELGDDKFDNLLGELKKKPKVEYLDDIIYISKYIELNSCADYTGDIKKSNDTLFIKILSTSDEFCTSTSIRKVTYIVRNNDKKKLQLMYE